MSDNEAVSKRLGATALLLAILSIAGRAGAQDDAQDDERIWRSEKGFGKRGSVLFSIENIFGFMDQTYASYGGNNNSNTDFNHKGFFPPGLVGTRLGVHALMSSGLTLGSILGFWTEGASSAGSNGTTTITVLQVGPRIGYAVSFPKTTKIGFWGRGGPTFQYADVGFSSGGQNSSSNSSNLWSFDLSFEAFLVWTPVEHFGLLFGPSIDVGLTGEQSSSGSSGSNNGSNVGNAGYHSVAFGFGLVFEL